MHMKEHNIYLLRNCISLAFYSSVLLLLQSAFLKYLLLVIKYMGKMFNIALIKIECVKLRVVDK